MGRFCIDKDSGMLVQYEIHIDEQNVSYDLLDLRMDSENEQFFIPAEENYYFKRLEDPSQNPLGIDLEPLLFEERLPLLGTFAFISQEGNRVLILFAEEEDYMSLSITLGSLVEIGSGDGEVIEIRGVPASLNSWDSCSNLVFNYKGMLIKVETNLSQLDIIRYGEKVIQELSKIDNNLLKYFEDLEQPNFKASTQESVLISEMQEEVPFDFKIPEFEGWSLAGDRQYISYSYSYKNRFFNNVLLYFENEDLELTLEMGVREDEKSNYKMLDTFTDQGIKYTRFTFPVGFEGKHMDYEGIKWKCGDLCYVLTINREGQGVKTLAKELLLSVILN